jgi:hypothetical protein
VKRTDGHTSTLPSIEPAVRIVDRRAQYQAKVRNAGLHLQPDFRLREIRGRAVKAWLFEHEARRMQNRAIAMLCALGWQPALPRPDAPPRKPGSAAA